MFKTIVGAVQAHARTESDKPAIIFRKTILSYAQLYSLVEKTAAVLSASYGIKAGDKVMITGVSRPEYLVVFLGIQYLHATTVPLDKVWREETVLKLYDFIEPVLIISDLSFSRGDVRTVSLKRLYQEAQETEQIPAGYTLPDMDGIAEMLFTTGTTGTPKGAMLTYENICQITNNNIEGVGFRSSDVVLDALPLCHSLGLREARMSLYQGATLVLQQGFSFPRELKTNAEQFHCTGFVCVPAIMERLTRTTEDFSGLFSGFRYMEIGAGSLSYDLKKRLPKMLPGTEIYNTWGSSETGGVIFLDVKNRQDKLTALGKPVASAEIRVVDGEGREIRADSIDNAGRLAVRGKMTMAGYYRMPEVNETTLVNGWLLTNDLVYTDDEGFVYMLGRADDIINVGGEKVSPIEIENVATEHEIVYDAACIGIPDEIMGQVPVLFVAAGEPYIEEDLIRFLSSRLEPFKIPQQIFRVGEIPRNRMKKLDRKAVRRLWEERKEMPDNEVIRTILSRHSVRDFLDQRIDRSILETLVRAGRQAPTGHNRQAWHFTVVTNKEMILRIKETGGTVSRREKKGFHGFNNPAALILVSFDSRNETGVQDAACATENMLLAAHSLGLGACWLNGLMRISGQPEIKALCKELRIPENYAVCAMVALGYPAGVSESPVRKENTVNWVE